MCEAQTSEWRAQAGGCFRAAVGESPLRSLITTIVFLITNTTSSRARRFCIISSYQGWLPRWPSGKRNYQPMQETQVQFLLRNIPWRRKWQATLLCCLENPMDRGAIVHWVAKSGTQPSTQSQAGTTGRFRAWGASLGQSRPSLIHSETCA